MQSEWPWPIFNSNPKDRLGAGGGLKVVAAMILGGESLKRTRGCR